MIQTAPRPKTRGIKADVEHVRSFFAHDDKMTRAPAGRWKTIKKMSTRRPSHDVGLDIIGMLPSLQNTRTYALAFYPLSTPPIPVYHAHLPSKATRLTYGTFIRSL
jgi:hypothetical protein